MASSLSVAPTEKVRMLLKRGMGNGEWGMGNGKWDDSGEWEIKMGI